MIIYFSSTGNCKYVAERLAEKLQDKAVSILETPKIELGVGEKLGFVFPTYFWRLPSVVDEYMKKVSITVQDKEPYVYFVATFGGTSGQTATYMKRHLKSKGLKLSLCYGIKTVDDWTVWYNVNNKEEVETVLSEEEVQIDELLRLVKIEAKVKKMKKTLPMIVAFGSNYFYSRARRTKHLNVNEKCIGCGLCEKECPTSAIEISNGKPTWVKERCAMCLHCVHSCPKFAINYDNKTQNNGQYKHP